MGDVAENQDLQFVSHFERAALCLNKEESKNYTHFRGTGSSKIPGVTQQV